MKKIKFKNTRTQVAKYKFLTKKSGEVFLFDFFNGIVLRSDTKNTSPDKDTVEVFLNSKVSDKLTVQNLCWEKTAYAETTERRGEWKGSKKTSMKADWTRNSGQCFEINLHNEKATD